VIPIGYKPGSLNTKARTMDDIFSSMQCSSMIVVHTRKVKMKGEFSGLVYFTV
jgi:hypothetical protein